MRQWLIGLGFLVVVGSGALWGWHVIDAASTPNEPIAAPVTIPVSRGDVIHTVTAPGQLVATREQVVGIDISGRLIGLEVRPGSGVQAGDVIARLDATPYDDALEAAELELTLAVQANEQQITEAELVVAANEALVQSTQAQIPSLTVAEVNLQAARDQEGRAAYEYQKAQDRHWEPPEVVEAYRLEWVATQRAVEIAEAEYNGVLRQQWAISQQVNALEQNVAQSGLNAQYLTESGIDPRLPLAVARAEADVAKTIIQAPFDGVVLDTLARPGEQLPAGAPLLILTDPTQGEIRTTIIEEDLSLIEIGQSAEIYFDAQPDALVRGEVARIVPQRVVGEARPLYYVYLTPVDPLPERIYAGMTADASVLIEKRSDVLRLPRSLVPVRNDGSATVAVWANGQSRKVEVTTGLRGDVYITVVDGLQEGDEVIGE